VARDGHGCRYCGTTTGTFVIDHIYPLSRGGGNVLENLALACEPCNLSKGAKTLDEWHGPVRAAASPYFN
jgi:5-methylcytosine-specific restriction endonuclease McrA